VKMALEAAQQALAMAAELPENLPKFIDEDDLSEEEPFVFNRIEEAQDWVEHTESTLKDCKEGLWSIRQIPALDRQRKPANSY